MAVIALVVHPQRSDALELGRQTALWLRQRGHQVHFQGAADAGPPGAADPGQVPGPGDLAPQACLDGELDLAVSLGGDGTMLRTVELAGPAGVPVLGVNLGHLGYLTEVESGSLKEALERFLRGDHGIDERMTLEVSLELAGHSAPPAPPRLALNETVVEKTLSGHTVRMAASIAGRPFISYAADGLLVATPTGSTAYNLSARGPIVSPRLAALIVTPISPHMLFDRALVLDPTESLRLEVLGDRPAAVVVDGGHVATLSPGDAVSCRAGHHPARLVSFGERDFHAILKAKFGLTDR